MSILITLFSQTVLKLRPRFPVRLTTRSVRRHGVFLASGSAVLVIFASVSAAQRSDKLSPFDPGNNVIVKIAAVKRSFPLKKAFDTGFCLTADCGFVVTTYHIAALADLPPKISGEKVSERDLATGPNDDGAVSSEFIGPYIGVAMKYTPVRDLAIFRLNHPLAKTGMHGISFYPDQLQYGQEVVIVGLSGGGLQTRNERRLSSFSCTFSHEFADGLLGFRCGLSQFDEPIGPTTSGGLVVDRKTQRAVGIVEGVGAAQGNLVIAVPIWSLADFVSKFQPDAYAALFSSQMYRPDLNAVPSHGLNVESVVPDRFVLGDATEPSPPVPTTPTALPQHRKEEQPEIQSLRARAQEQADGMKNFMAEQTLSNGNGNTTVAWSKYEVRVVDGQEKFRQYPDGAQELSSLPLPQSQPTALVFEAEWADLPNMVGTKLALKVEQVQDRVENGQRVKVFLYRAEIEDNVCTDREITDYGLFRKVWSGPVACNGEVWTDGDLNIIRITQNLTPPASKTSWNNLHIVVAYGWLREPGEEPKLVPASEFFQGENHHKVYWCKGEFTNYREFSVKTRLSTK